jgi:hypothetical protein
MLPPHPAARFEKTLLSARRIAESPVRGGSRIVLAEPLFAQSLGLELYVCFDLRAEIARLWP